MRTPATELVAPRRLVLFALLALVLGTSLRLRRRGLSPAFERGARAGGEARDAQTAAAAASSSQRGCVSSLV